MNGCHRNFGWINFVRKFSYRNIWFIKKGGIIFIGLHFYMSQFHRKINKRSNFLKTLICFFSSCDVLKLLLFIFPFFFYSVRKTWHFNSYFFISRYFFSIWTLGIGIRWILPRELPCSALKTACVGIKHWISLQQHGIIYVQGSNELAVSLS